ncbi:MAG TPA: TonB-dependent receptor [Gemmatimonadales bacterium]|nr:TonB-dependent receptor [Gemmatimonadales bacterium]
MSLVARLAAAPLALMLLSAAPVVLAGQAGVIRGRVTDAGGGALARASVSVDGTGFRAMTDAAGAYQLTDIPAGTYTLRVRLIGYATATARVTVRPGEVAEQDVRLEATAIGLAPVDVVVGSRARHTAAEELAVPVDIFPAEVLATQGTSETSQILQSLAPSVNFPRQSVTDATDIVRPFTLRGLSPDHTLVLLNGLRRHQTAVVNTFAYGTGAGSSGVDLNAIPSSAFERIEVLRDGASAQYGSDAIAGVVNLVLKEGPFTPFLNASTGRYIPDDYPDDGTTVNVSGGWGFSLGRGSLALFGEFLDRQPTNRAWADPFEDAGTGETDVVNAKGQVVVKRNPVPQPNHHWGDGLERDVLTLANLRLPVNPAGTAEVYGFGGYSFRKGTGNGYRRYASSARNWPEIYPLGFLPEFAPDVTDYSAAGGFRARAGAWSLDIGGSFGHNDFEYHLRNTLNVSLGPCLDPANPCAPGEDGVLGTPDDPGIANQTAFFAGKLLREEAGVGITAARELGLGLPAPVNVAVGAQFRRERYRITAGEPASYLDGGHPDQFGDDAAGGSQVFPGFAPTDETDQDRTNVGIYADLETSLTPRFLAAVAGRFERYSDFGEKVTGKVALRYQPSAQLTLRAAGSTGFRAPGLGQSHFSKVVTNVIAGAFEEIGVFPVDHPAARALGSQPLQEETSVNLSAGLAFSPTDRFTVTLDYFRIAIDDRILLGATFDDDTTRAILARAGYPDIAGVQYFTNGLDTRTWGVDLTASLRVPAGRGAFDFTATVNRTENEIVRVDPLPAVLRNSAETGLIDTVTWIAIEEERPDWRGSVTAQYTTGRLQALVRGSYYGKFSSAQPGFCDLCRERYGEKTLFDAEVGYRFGQVSLAAGIRNLFDTYPDQPSSQVVVDADGNRAMDYNNNFGTFPWAAASPFGYNGRYLYARLETYLMP